MTEPRTIFFEGMEAHEQRLRINPQALGQVLVSHGIDRSEAMNFDVGLIPSESAILKGAYVAQSGNPKVTTAAGEEVILRDRVLELHVSPKATPSLVVSKFTLLHETGHMYRGISGEAPERLGYQRQEFVDRVQCTGKVSAGVFGAVAAGYLATSGIDTEPLRTIIESATVSTAIPAGLCAPSAVIPWEIAWFISAEEWRMHAFALRNWQAGIVDLRADSS